MKNTYNLINVSKQILNAEPGLSKVCFAKIIYFVHKGLVKKELVGLEDLRFIRMPLGPVPVGFMEITQSQTGIRIEEAASGGLVYNAQKYFSDEDSNLPDNIKVAVSEMAKVLARFSTSTLVERSHRDPSWIERSNGEEYSITVADLANPVPSRTKAELEPDIDNQNLQGLLLSGMVNDIAEESTKLEYPDYGKTD